MRIIDLTLDIRDNPSNPAEIEPYAVPLAVRGVPQTATCYRLRLNGMSGTYIDFPGHLESCADGADAGNAPLDSLLMRPATVIHLRRQGRPRAVTAAELDAAGVDFQGEALIIHALESRTFMDVDAESIPYYDPSAIEWIVARAPRLFASDIYEKRPDQQGIFVELFRHGIRTVCCPVNLDQITQAHPRCSVIPLKARGITQIPCRFFVTE